MEHVVAPNVDDEDDGRPEFGDVGEVLVRPHAEVRSPGQSTPGQRIHDIEVSALVGDQVVGVEVATWLRYPMDERGEGRRIDTLLGRQDRGAGRSRVAPDEDQGHTHDPCYGAPA